MVETQVEVVIEDRKSLGTNVVAAALPPSNGMPGAHVHINNNYDNLSLNQKVYIMVHELGHILGLAHTDLITSNPWWYIPGTPDWGSGQYDYNSIMLSGGSIPAWGSSAPGGSFSAGDFAAIQSMYGTPIWSHAIVGSDICSPTNPSTYTLNLGTNLTNFTVSWYVNNVLRQSGSSFNFTPTGLTNGQTATLRASYSYGGSTPVNVFKSILVNSSSSTIQTAIDFTVYNNSSQHLNDVNVGLTGNVGSTYTNMFNENLYTMYQGQSLGYPNYVGNTFTAISGTTISNLYLNVSLSGTTSSNFRVTAAIDYGTQVSSIMNNGYTTLLLPNSTVPNANGQRRRVTIYIDNGIYRRIIRPDGSTYVVLEEDAVAAESIVE